MASNIKSKLNQVILNIPHGAVVTTEWLKERGVSPKLAWWYVKSNWLERIADKAYKKPQTNIAWIGVVNALQTQLHKQIHISGKSALGLIGKAHYLLMGRNLELDLTLAGNTFLPAWFKSKHLSKDKFKVHRSMLLASDDLKEFLIHKEFEGLDIILSCAELAILEVLNLILTKQDLIEAAQLMESLPYLRANRVQELLEACTSIKAKRIYLYLASKYQHKWLKKLDLAKIDLGKGKRVVAKGGIYDSEFQISVPVIDGD